MNKDDLISISIAFVLGMIGTIFAYFNASSNPLFGLPIIALLIITFLISFTLLFVIFKYLVFGLILKKKEIIPSREIPKATSTVKNTFVPGSNAPQAREVQAPKVQSPTPVKVPEPVKEEVHKDVSLMVENITEPQVVPEKKDVLVLDNTIDHVKNEERNVRREEIVKESVATTLVDLNPEVSKSKIEDKPSDPEAPKFRKLSTFEDIDKK
ncbi:MAG: hypothetical protein WCF78_03475 [archaeon]